MISATREGGNRRRGKHQITKQPESEPRPLSLVEADLLLSVCTQMSLRGRTDELPLGTQKRLNILMNFALASSLGNYMELHQDKT